MSLWSPVDLVCGGTGKTNPNLTNNSINSPQFRAKREDKCAQSYTNSLLYDHLLRRSSSKLSDNNNVITKDLNSAINRFVMTSNDTSLAFHSLKKKQGIKGSVNISIGSETHISGDQALPLVKSKNSDEVNENCDKNYKKIRNSDTIMNSNEEEDSPLPLDLCVKKARDESNVSSNALKKNSIFAKSSCNPNPALNVHNIHNNVSTSINTPQYSPSSHSSRKRGRKPKSLLAQTAHTSNIIVPSNLASLSNFIDTKPRKRGRPPTLSPPLCALQSQQPLAAHSSNLNKALSSSGAFQHHFPYAVLNTPLQPGWPSLSSTGQLVFPDKLNGNEINNYKLHKTSANVSESSDNIDSLASDSESNEDSISDSSSQISRNKTSDSYGQHLNERFNENELRIPLQFGWRRETKITKISRTGLEGEVVYYSPCSRKLKNNLEITKYLSKNGITNVSKDYFSYNPKAIVGTFVQRLYSSGTDILLTEKEVRKQLEELNRKPSNRSEKKRKTSNESMVLDAIQSKEQQIKNLMERTRALIPRDAKRVKLDEMKRFGEMDLKEHERLESMHLEKVAKTHQMEEVRRKRREDMEKQRQEEMVRKVQEKELKRQQLELMREQEVQRRRELLIMADLERERRRQHMMLVRALEAHKKQEEKERKKEEILAERLRIQEKKIQKKRLEMELLRELKKPIDDMMLKDLKPFPTLNRIPGLKLPGKAFADTLMVFEFLHNFGETLGFDMESLPTLNTLTLALLNIDESSEEELLSVIHHLLICAIEDPGIPVNMTTIMGQKLKDAPITNYNITEILRLYFLAFDNNIRDDAKEHRLESRMARLLQNACPFLSLNATQKAEILAFLCNELLCNQTIVKQIEDNIETVGNIRRDKWVHENELRKWKTIKSKREKRSEQQMEDNKKNELETGDDDSADSDAEETQNGSIATINDSEDEPGLSNEEIDKKIDKLNKQFNQMNNKLNKATNMYRVCPLGQDRYRRRYWVLPNSGGVFVEGIESGETEEIQNNIWNEGEEEEESLSQQNDIKTEEILEENAEQNKDIESSKECSEETSCETIEEKSIDEKSDENIDEDIKEDIVVKDTNDEELKEVKKESIDKTEEIVENLNDLKTDNNIDIKNDLKSDSKSDLKIDSKVISKSDVKKSSKKLKNNEEMTETDVQSSMRTDSQWMSPFFASVLAGSLMLNNGSTGNGMSSSQMPLSFPFGLDMANNSTTGSVSKANQSTKNWFSILPRMPCDDSVSESSQSDPLDSIKKENSNKKVIKLNETSVSTQQQKLLQQSPLSSLMNGLPSNLFMQAFLYPHILSSLFNQNSLGGGPCPPDTSPFSLNSSSTKNSRHFMSNSSQKTESNNSESQESTKTTNCDLLVDGELDICPSIQKRIAQQKEEQYDRPQKIRNEYQFGWWRITDSSQLKNMIEVLHNRGVRERQLQKHLIKCLNFASQSCKSNVAELEITDMDSHMADKCVFGAPKDGKCPHDLCSTSDYCKEVALRFDIAVLEQIEALEEKIGTSSMQIRNWKPLPRISCDQSITFRAAATFVRPITRLSEIKTDETTDESVINSCGDSSEANESRRQLNDESESGEINPVDIGRDRLLALEAVIERRYLKPPLGFKSNTILVSTNSSEVGQMDEYNDNAADENATSGLLRWRDAVREAECSAEIALCLHFLESCIAWDKSIMRASCQFCGSGENEAQLLLCDGCDKGYHTYCFKPKMDTIPDGDWFCFECQNKNTIDKVCIVCGKKGKLLNCDSCAKVFHPNCLDPPVTKPLKGKWICHMCVRKPKKPNLQKSSKKTLNSEEKLIESINTASNPLPITSTTNTTKDNSKRLSNGTNKSDKETKKEKKCKQTDKSSEFNSCKTILDAMESHEHSWPFLLPVNTKQFPTYKKIIKKPMDTTTIRSKLDSSGYKNKEEFAADVRLIFDNCVTFNEDESPVGQAGHTLRAFFDIKMKELFGS